MKIIISPAKKMNRDTDSISPKGLPVYLDKTRQIRDWLMTLDYSQLKALWKCNDKIAGENYQRLLEMDLERSLTPAILSYEGIAYQYMAPGVFSDEALDYVQEHLRILSGFYGILKPLDGVVPYRLEMQAAAEVNGCRNLYEFWSDSLYKALIQDPYVSGEPEETVINLASAEYSKCIERYLAPGVRYVTVIFGEEKDGKIRQKATLAKMARGEMVRFMAEHAVKSPEELKAFSRLGFCWNEARSTPDKLVFCNNSVS
ncbi:MAG TPA: peroxide stress protein YaaA [Candidatus Scybalocola faecigallinarum]|uniref:UPF0246 protein IAB46_10770 n=1 Tax=Candidatus Scybalocola faecigallinarum TaxID=2840941 RepID=A0A9D1F5R4_9FIRM|nr:peroxide stress protein YaaA [Candidatus Scybalocola faecigallinarum]